MGFFDIFFRKKEESFEKANLENLEDAAKKKISEHEESFKHEAVKFFSQLKQQKDEIKKRLGELSSAETKDQVDPQLLKIAMTSRKSFVEKFKTLAEQEELNDFSILFLSQTFNQLSAKLDDVNASTVAEFVSIKEVFKNEAFAVTDEMKTLKKIYDQFKEKLRKELDAVQPYDEITTKIKILKEEKERLDNLRKDLENIQQKNENLLKENEMMRINLQKLEESNEWKEYLQMKRRLSEKENEKTEVISQVVQKFSSIERPFKKLNNLLQKTESEMNKKLLEKYIASPFDAFLEDYEKKTINSALEQAAKYIEENKIDEKKSLEKIKEMISSDAFNNLDKKWHEINVRYAELSEKIENSEVAKKKEEMLKNISMREAEMKQNRKEKVEEQLRALEDDFATHKEDLKQLAKNKLSMEVEL